MWVNIFIRMHCIIGGCLVFYMFYIMMVDITACFRYYNDKFYYRCRLWQFEYIFVVEVKISQTVQYQAMICVN